jgi:hypothetical protein
VVEYLRVLSHVGFLFPGVEKRNTWDRYVTISRNAQSSELTQPTEGSCTLTNKKIAKPESTALSPIRIPIAGPNESLWIICRKGLRDRRAAVTTTRTLKSVARIYDREPHVFKKYVPTRDEIKRQCSVIRRQWSPAERARRWRGEAADRGYESQPSQNDG